MQREDVTFRVGGVELAAWLTLPDVTDGTDPYPTLVMAHGFGMTRRCRLDDVADGFAAAGIATWCFDYRGFGDSGGQPRQVLDVDGQREDYVGALTAARAHPSVDASRVGIWGTSFSGGHVFHLAARLPDLACAIAQVPFADGPASLRGDGPSPREPQSPAGPSKADWARHAMTLVRNAGRDLARARLGRDPLLVPIAGELGSGAVIAAPGAEDMIRVLVPEGIEWRNEVAARIALRIPRERPVKDAADIACPLFVAVCDGDRITPPGPALAAAEAAPLGESKVHHFTHFDAYVGDGLAALLTDEIAFARRAFGMAAG